MVSYCGLTLPIPQIFLAVGLVQESSHVKFQTRSCKSQRLSFLVLDSEHGCKSYQSPKGRTKSVCTDYQVIEGYIHIYDMWPPTMDTSPLHIHLRLLDWFRNRPI